MDAMILAAGLGTRLRPLTDHTPKALIEVGGVTILEGIARRLVAAGADRIIVNVHRHADRIRVPQANRVFAPLQRLHIPPPPVCIARDGGTVDENVDVAVQVRVGIRRPRLRRRCPSTAC